ncbi:cell division protein FtsQ/DivIB [Candidatus Albibeggiatoa sp. nov. BB20]|uniref:cell division protein FtsQ/DivIB n=1 Tax=Candidatus Albibeggiatoa sp. nov. BB20 TaxID=3162723 RepID=UPI0033659C53
MNISNLQARRKATDNEPLQRINGGQYWLMVLIILAGSLLIVGILLWWLSHPQSFLVKKIIIEGQQQTDPSEIQKAIVPYLNVGLFYLQLDKIEQAALTLPWIKNVTAKPVWFNKLQLQITEYQPLAKWQQNMYIDSTGELFNIPQQLVNVPHFTGDKDCIPEMITRYQQIQTTMQAIQLKLQKLSCQPRKAWAIHLDKGIQLNLGRGEIMPRLQRFTKVYHRILAQYASSLGGDLGLYIDLRYANGIAVRLARTE